MTQPRHTADTITDAALDALYAELGNARHAIKELTAQRDGLAARLCEYVDGAAVKQAACSVCGRTYQVRRDGRIRHHVRDQPGGQWSRGTCPGSRKPPKETSTP